MNSLSKFNKAVVAAVVGILITTVRVIQSQVAQGWNWSDTWTVVLTALGAALVYLTPNTTVPGKYDPTQSVIDPTARAAQRPLKRI